MIPIELKPVVVSETASILDTMKAIDAGAMQIAFVVNQQDQLEAVITDGDLRRAIISGASLDQEIEPFVSKSFHSVREEASRSEALDLMKCFSVKHLPVLNADGELCGLHSLNQLIKQTTLPNVAMILAGGKGTRLGKLTTDLPKPMIKVAGRPILERIILHLIGGGIKKIFLSVNYLSTVIEEHFGNGSDLGCEIGYLHEDEPLGTGGPLALLKDKGVTDPVIVMNGDLITDFNVEGILKTHEHDQNSITIGVRPYEHEVPFGCVVSEGSEITELIEKPTLRQTINAGIYVVSSDLIPDIPLKFFPITELVGQCLQSAAGRVGMFPIEDWIDIGLPENLAEARGDRKSN